MNISISRHLILIHFLMAFILTGCAGPMSPFGAFPLSGAKSAGDLGREGKGTSTRISFTPGRQVLHSSTLFTVTIEDPQGVPPDFHFHVHYNGLDVTREFLRNAEITSLDPSSRTIRMTTKFLRLQPTRENKVLVAYRRDESSPAIKAYYQPPVCYAFTHDRPVRSIPEFDPPRSYIQYINEYSSSKRLNPNFVAALIAQESSFNPNAASLSRALGLTQITASGEAEVIKKFSNWPRYNKINEMSAVAIRYNVMTGTINPDNEWRLNPPLAIQGGIEYLTYLTDYWNRADKRAQIERALGASETTFSEVMLASYNSGAARVSEALEKLGKNYLQDEELGEANKYVHRVVSYCHHFEKRED